MNTLFPYQIKHADTLERILRQNRVACDLSDPGTGKTKFCSRVEKRFLWSLPEGTLIIVNECQKCKGLKSINAYMLIAAKLQQYRLLLCSATAASNPLEMKAVRAALAKPEIAAVFRSHHGAEVYNEQDVDAIADLDGQEVWVSGIIDRLVLEYDADGKKPVRAAIYDYKTNQIREGNTTEQHDAELKKHYLPQMRSYCSLITKMFTLPPGAVTATLIAVPSNAYDKAHLVPIAIEP